MWHRGGGHKKKLRLIDFKRDKNGIPATVFDRIRSQPFSADRVAGLRRWRERCILQWDGLRVGQKLVSGPEADILVGNALPLKNFRLERPFTTSS